MRDLDAICLGEALIDFVSLESGVSLLEAATFRKAAGGAPANVAVGLARLGARAAFLGKVGDEPFGRFIQETLDRDGVDTSGMVFSPEYRTGLAFVSLTASGERDFVFFRNPSADMTFAPEELAEALFPRAWAFHYGSITLIDEAPRAATLRAVALAQDAGALISYDPNLRLNLWPSEDDARRAMQEGMAHARVAKIAEEELEFLTGIGDAERGARQLLEGGAELVAVTAGARGCRYFTATAQGDLPGFSVATVDTTGAGDGFVAGMLTGLLPTWRGGRRPGAMSAAELDPIFRYANAVGALATTVHGAIPALPTAARVDALLGE